MIQISKTNLNILGIILFIKEGELENLIPLKIIISYLSENLMFKFKGQFVSDEYWESIRILGCYDNNICS